MNDLVLDASAAVEALTGRKTTAVALRSRLSTTGCHAPHLIDAEIGHVLRRRVVVGDITPTVAETALDAASRLVDQHYAHAGIAGAAWELRHNLTYHDALYVALAARLGVPLLTGDARLARAPGLPCNVEVIGSPD